MATADIITLATGSETPLLREGVELSQHVHINCLGSSQKHQCELDPRLLLTLDLVLDHPEITLKESGVIKQARAQGLALKPKQLAQVGLDQRTVYLSTGNGSQDLVCAIWLYNNAVNTI